MMNPELKSEWVAALRSGKYRQARGHICASSSRLDSFGFCCLGVLLSVHQRRTPGQPVFQTPNVYAYVEETLLQTEQFVAVDKLVSMNDAQRKSFAEIADWVEENL